MIEFLESHPSRSRSTPARRPTLVSGLLGFLLGIAPLIATVPSSDQPQDAYPLTTPNGQLSSLERGRQADAARLQGQADRWLKRGRQADAARLQGQADRWFSETCHLTAPPTGLRWRRTDRT
jgi:hypothetical protein